MSSTPLYDPTREESAETPAAPEGLAAYSRSLDAVGGEQIAAMARTMDRTVAVALYQCPPYDLHVPPLGVSRLEINLTASRVTGGAEFERRRMFDASRHSMFLTPAAVATSWRKSSPSRHLNICFHPRLHIGEAEPAGDLEDTGPVFNVTLAGSSALVEQLAAEIATKNPFAVEAVDCLARLLLVKFARRRARFADAQMLSADLLRRLEEFVDANLAHRILIADMAAVVGLPPQAFAQAYVRYTGRTPHQFVLGRRIDCAAELLRHSLLALAEVAARSGFSSQQHMTHVLSERLGMSPAAVRQLGLHKTRRD